MELKPLCEGITTIKQLLDLNHDSAIAVSDLNHYIFVEYLPIFDLGVRVGQPIKETTVIGLAMKTKKPIKKIMDRSNFGIPYIATAAPLFNEVGEVSGGIVMCMSTDKEEGF